MAYSESKCLSDIYQPVFENYVSSSYPSCSEQLGKIGTSGTEDTAMCGNLFSTNMKYYIMTHTTLLQPVKM